MGWKYATKSDYRAAARARSKARYHRERQELAPIRAERPSRMPAELAKREQLRREIRQIRWVS